ncbi:Tryptophan--tRNA ligase, mitochondrial [Kappamyces sp. JEL0680]|nr:Tryptophan--tRNA ligase, mitochondrial [Kappamyces sp. JEL0680]
MWKRPFATTKRVLQAAEIPPKNSFYSLKQVCNIDGDTLAPPAIPEPPKSDGQLVCNAEFSGFMSDHLDFVAYFARYTAHQMEMPTGKVIHAPTNVQKWHTVKGPFVHAKSKEVFERQTHKRLLQIFDSHPETVKAWINYVNSSLPAGVDFKAERFEWNTLGFVDGLEKPAVLEKPDLKTRSQEVLDQAEAYIKQFK